MGQISAITIHLQVTQNYNSLKTTTLRSRSGDRSRKPSGMTDKWRRSTHPARWAPLLGGDFFGV
ncbi:hypothetical protein [Chamaesiphon sp.]|uniref:hypothetical protein n=1 Tax=Chamaesiphon sp. TaxID=2814140 RepID=UPI00359388C2